MMIEQRRFAVVGAGPSGLFAAAGLAQRFPGARIDVIDRQLSPFGLVRYGVAPDHPTIKTVTATFDRIITSTGVRFFGGIELGRDVQCADLTRCYDAVVHATGAPHDRQLDIPGEQLCGVVGATDFVRWYNGHPDAAPLDLLSAPRIVVVGAGNVALDVARFLVRNAAQLGQTDIPDGVVRALATRRVREVSIVARRAPAFTKFSNKELRELGRLDGVRVNALPGPYEFCGNVSRETRANLDLFRAWSKSASEHAFRAQLTLLFSLRPIAILGAERVEGVRFALTRTAADDSVQDTGERIDLPADTVVRCVGSVGAPVPDLPFDAQRRVVRNDRGRVVTERGEPLPGQYVTGWLKRGATGVIGTNKPDAAETVEQIAEDLAATATGPAKLTLDAFLAATGRRWFDYSHWARIDEAELQLGAAQGRARAKIASWDDLRRVAGAPCGAAHDDTQALQGA